MTRITAVLRPYRIVALAVAVSFALHAALFVAIPERVDLAASAADETFTARLEPAKVASATPAPPSPRIVRARTRPAPARPAPSLAPVPELLAATGPADGWAVPMPSASPLPPPAPAHEDLAMAEPIIPWVRPPPVPPPEPEAFPLEGLPQDLTIDYDLNSAIAAAHASYHWVRDGDGYRITGQGELGGLAQLFVDGRMTQESVGIITSAGLRPERFVERRSGNPDEGLEFDWVARQVTFDRGPANRKTVPLAEDTVDWLTMIFQLAHQPPRSPGQTMTLRVYTQRRLYDFHLEVAGIEEIAIPLGAVRALHLHHIDPEGGPPVDVWLGIDEHYLPVKLRYPVAKKRLMVEQSAVRITEH